MSGRFAQLQRAGIPNPEQAQALFNGITPYEFARRVGNISPQTVHRLIKSGRIAAVAMNPGAKRIRYRIPTREVDSYLRDTSGSPAQAGGGT